MLHHDEKSESPNFFPAPRKEPIGDAAHVRDSIVPFMEVQYVTENARDDARRRITAAAKTFDVNVSEKGWRDLR